MKICIRVLRRTKAGCLSYRHLINVSHFFPVWFPQNIKSFKKFGLVTYLCLFFVCQSLSLWFFVCTIALEKYLRFIKLKRVFCNWSFTFAQNVVLSSRNDFNQTLCLAQKTWYPFWKLSLSLMFGPFLWCAQEIFLASKDWHWFFTFPIFIHSGT